MKDILPNVFLSAVPLTAETAPAAEDWNPDAAGAIEFQSSCGGVESRHAGFDGQVDEAVNITAPERVRRWQQPLREQVRQAPPNWPRSRSPGPTNGGADAYALSSAEVALGPQETNHIGEIFIGALRLEPRFILDEEKFLEAIEPLFMQRATG